MSIMRKYRWLLLGAAVLILGYCSVLMVDETEVALVTQFGKPLYTIRQAGPHAKWFFQSVTSLIAWLRV